MSVAVKSVFVDVDIVFDDNQKQPKWNSKNLKAITKELQKIMPKKLDFQGCPATISARFIGADSDDPKWRD